MAVGLFNQPLFNAELFNAVSVPIDETNRDVLLLIQTSEVDTLAFGEVNRDLVLLVQTSEVDTSALNEVNRDLVLLVQTSEVDTQTLIEINRDLVLLMLTTYYEYPEIPPLRTSTVYQNRPAGRIARQRQVSHVGSGN